MLTIIKFRKLMFSFIDRLHVSSLSQGCDPEGGKGGGYWKIQEDWQNFCSLIENLGS